MLWGAEKLVPAEYWCPYGISFWGAIMAQWIKVLDSQPRGPWLMVSVWEMHFIILIAESLRKDLKLLDPGMNIQKQATLCRRCDKS